MSDSVRRLFSGNINIYYGQFYIDDTTDEDSYLEPDSAFLNQANGICGAAHTGKLFFVTGIQDGVIAIDVEVCDSKVAFDDSFDECVEVSFQQIGESISLCEWGLEDTHKLELPRGDYRVRYYISGMEKDYSDDSDFEAPLAGQRHLIQFLPAAEGPDRILKQSSENAAYWHREWGSAS